MRGSARSEANWAMSQGTGPTAVSGSRIQAATGDQRNVQGGAIVYGETPELMRSAAKRNWTQSLGSARWSVALTRPATATRLMAPRTARTGASASHHQRTPHTRAEVQEPRAAITAQRVARLETARNGFRYLAHLPGKSHAAEQPAPCTLAG